MGVDKVQQGRCGAEVVIVCIFSHDAQSVEVLELETREEVGVSPAEIVSYLSVTEL